MSTFPIPSDYVSSLVAVERANEEWGERDGLAKLIGLLIDGKLCTWKVDRRGHLEEILREAYQDEGIHRVLTYVNSNRISADKPDYRIAFLEKQLDKVLPSAWQKFQLKRSLKAEPAGGANVEQIRPLERPNIGKPSNPNLDDFWIEATRMIWNKEQGDINQTQEEFFDAMEKWAKKRMNKPYARGTIEIKIKALWRKLKLGNSEG